MLKLVDDEDKILLNFFQQCTEKMNPCYYKSKRISKELNNALSSAKIAYYLAHWPEVNVDDTYKIEKYAQSGTHATWRIERCH